MGFMTICMHSQQVLKYFYSAYGSEPILNTTIKKRT
jgi:hypothetical protein